MEGLVLIDKQIHQTIIPPVLMSVAKSREGEVLEKQKELQRNRLAGLKKITSGVVICSLSHVDLLVDS